MSCGSLALDKEEWGMSNKVEAIANLTVIAVALVLGGVVLTRYAASTLFTTSGFQATRHNYHVRRQRGAGA